jgi:hypothetical protein
LTLEERWDKRLENWALWVINGGATPGTSGAYGFIGGGSSSTSSGVPALVGEALDTDALVQKLENSLKQAVVAWYVWTGTVEERARDADVHRDTLTDRVKRARFRLEELSWQRRREISVNRLPQNLM